MSKIFQTSYKLRVDLSEVVTSDDVLTLVAKYSRVYAWCYETASNGKNPYMHFYIETTFKKPAIRKAIRSLHLIGNKSYSLGDVEFRCPDYLSYMMKQGPVTYINIPQDFIDSANEFQERVVREMAEKKAARKNKLPVISQILQSKVCEQEQHICSHDTCIALAILDYHKNNPDLQIRRFQLKAYFDTIKFQSEMALGKNLQSTEIFTFLVS